MRPLRLVTQALGPYPGRQTLDFRLFGDRSLFLIHGPTGSGKTSILDAISFALYGRPAGSERDPKRMRSDHAEPHIPTEVVFDFALHNDVYRVYRKPEHALPKKRGMGMANTKAEAFLALRTGLDDDSKQGRTLETGWKTVTAKIEELLGFRSDQFSQVVMLPQGEFQRLLMANSRERQSILEVLFQTEWYSQIEQALKGSAKDLQTKMNERVAARNALLVQGQATSFEEMQTRHAADKERHEQVKVRLLQLKEDEAKAREAFEQGKRLLEKFEVFRRAQTDMEVMQSQERDIKLRRVELDLAQRAQNIVPDEKALLESSAESQKFEKTRKTARSALEAARLKKNDADKLLDTQRATAPEIDKAKQELNRLTDLSDQIHQLEAAQREWSKAEKASESSVARFLTSSKALEDHISLEERLREERDNAQKTAGNVELLKLLLQKLESDLKNIKKLGNLNSETKKIEEQVRRAVVACGRLENTAAQQRNEFRELEEIWIKSQAAVLAQKLVTGEPCPVCGSLEHPKPAQPVERLPKEDELKAKRESLDQLQSELARARDTKAQYEKEHTERRAQMKSLQGTLAHIESRTETDLVRQRQSLTNELKKAEDAVKKVQEAERQLLELKARLEKTRKEVDEAQSQKEEAQQALAVAETKAETIARNIPENLRTVTALQRASSTLSKKIDSMEAALKKAEKNLQNAQQEVARCEAALEAADNNCMMASQKLLNQKQKFERVLSQQGFRDETHFKESKRTDAEIERLKADIDGFEKALANAKDRLERAEKEVAHIERPDVDALRETATTAKAQFEDALKGEAGLCKQIEQEESLIRQYSVLQDQINSLEHQFSVVDLISSVANGGNPLGITFQRFVLSTLLDDVLAAATQRFHIMSNGRFALNRLDQRTDKRSPGGLDIEVYDAYTGTSRPVNTLSGGESFLASLSLALGLADVVQAYAGGIRLDAIFVDEGFGSLDPEALDLAFRALVDLQQSGRLVGVISHVPELKERIDARLEVTTSQRGSTARIIVP